GIAMPPIAGIHKPPPLVVAGSAPRPRRTATQRSTNTQPKITAQAPSITHQRRAIWSDALLFGASVDWSFSPQPAATSVRRRTATVGTRVRTPGAGAAP